MALLKMCDLNSDVNDLFLISYILPFLSTLSLFYLKSVGRTIPLFCFLFSKLPFYQKINLNDILGLPE